MGVFVVRLGQAEWACAFRDDKPDERCFGVCHITQCDREQRGGLAPVIACRLQRDRARLDDFENSVARAVLGNRDAIARRQVTTGPSNRLNLFVVIAIVLKPELFWLSQCNLRR